MPYLSRGKIEQIASRVVTAYSGAEPQASSTGGRICPEILAQKLLGLKVEYRSLSRNGSILGMTAFEKVGVRVYENNAPSYYFLDGHTILIDASLAEEGTNPGRRSFTLMHEPCHQIFRVPESLLLYIIHVWTPDQANQLGGVACQHIDRRDPDAQGVADRSDARNRSRR